MTGQYDRHLRIIGQAAPSAKPQIVVPGMMPIEPEISKINSKSARRPLPCLIRSSKRKLHAVPSRQGVHWPHDSWAKNRQELCIDADPIAFKD